MIDALIRFSLRNRAIVLAAALLLCAYGVAKAVRMPIDVFPDLTAPTVTVLTEAPGMAPTEIESLITFPIETALNGAPAVRRVRSSTSVGISVVWVEFAWDADVQVARQTVAERLALVLADLPAAAGRPVIAPMTSIMGEILFLALSSEQHELVELRDLTDAVLRRRLLSVPGVAQVTPIGGGRKEYQVRLDPERLRAHGISVAEVAAALAASNESVSAGFVDHGGSELLVQGRGHFHGVEDVRATVVATRGGVSVRAGDLGEVKVGEAPRRGTGSSGGRPAVVIGVQKQPEVNTLALTSQLDAVLDELERELPAGVHLDRHVLRQADFIEVAVANVAEALRDGALLVVLVILLFLANGRATLITLTAIPLSLVVSVLVLDVFHSTINTMTLGGMAIAIGALVDDAVIDVENVFRRLRENALRPADERQNTLAVVLDASIEIRTSIVFATFIIVLVFLPLFFLSGVEGRLLRPLGIAYVTALLASLLVAVTVTPVLCHLLLPHSRSVRRGAEPWLVRALKAGYARVLRPTLARPWLVLGPILALLVAALVSTRHMGLAFLPEFHEGALTIEAVTLPGTSLAESDALGRAAEELLLEIPEVRAVSRRTGRAELDEHAQGVEASELDVALLRSDRSREELLEDVRAALSLVPGTTFSIGQPISHRIDHMLSGTRASVAVKLFGDDLHALRALADRVHDAMEGVAGVVDLAVEQQADVPLLTVRFDRAALGRLGVRMEDAAHALEAAYKGLPVTKVLEGRRAYDLVLRLGDERPWPVAALEALPIDAPDGRKVPLHAIAEVRRDVGPNTISREAVERKIVVSCNVAGRDVASVVEDCRARIEPLVAGAPGHRVEYGGQFESAIQARGVLSLFAVAVVIGIGFLLHLAFGSARDALLVMLNLPLALIGGVAGVFATGGVLTIASLIGFITVFGIATRNGIMLVSHIRHLQLKEGVMELREAVFRGAMERLAPILMTALATALALVPLALGGGEPGKEIQTPMATVILWGLATSMVLNMLVVPALYLRFGRPARSAGAAA